MARLLLCILLGMTLVPAPALAGWMDFFNPAESQRLFGSGIRTLLGQSSTCANLASRGGEKLAADPAEAVALFQRYEAEGCADEYAPQVNMLLGVLCLIGEGMPRDVPQGVRRLRKSVKDEALDMSKRANAAIMLGLLYDDEDLGYRDPKKAERWFKKAIKLGSSSAHFVLGCLYDDEETPLYDRKKAEKHLVIAAEAGNVKAQTYLGIFYYYAEDDSPADLANAVKWLTKAGNADSAEAQFILGTTYEDETLPEYYDPERAVRWYTMAVARGYTDARLALGRMLAGGVGTTKNLDQAQQQFTAAAMEGSIEGVLCLMFLLDDKLEATDPNDPRLMAEVLKWILLAEKMDSRVAETMTDWLEDVHDTAEAVAEWERVKSEFINTIPPAMLEQVTKEAAELYETIGRKTANDAD